MNMISNYKNQQAIKKMAKIYKEIAKDDKRLAEDFLSIWAETAAIYKTIKIWSIKK